MKDFKVMSALKGKSPNDLIKKSLKEAEVDTEWRRELSAYIDKKNYVDHRSYSRIKKDTLGYWPQRK